jgi:hypothetical protein
VIFLLGAALHLLMFADPGGNAPGVKLITPAVNYRMDEASASSAPWIDSNGWRFLRDASGHYYYDVSGASAALAAAEGHAYGVDAAVNTDSSGVKPLAAMRAFLKELNEPKLPALANIGYVDDGSAQSGELMNLLVRRNLLFRVIPAPDPQLNLNVRFGSSEYPKTEKDPSLLAQKVRSNLGDEKRLVRVFGSEVVIARLMGSSGRVRVCLLNYAAAARRVQGIRVSVLGNYPRHKLHAYNVPDASLVDYSVENGVTEFTLPELREYAVVDLSE